MKEKLLTGIIILIFFLTGYIYTRVKSPSNDRKFISSPFLIGLVLLIIYILYLLLIIYLRHKTGRDLWT